VFPVSRLGADDVGLMRGLRLLGSSDGVKEEIHAIRSRRGQHHPLVQKVMAAAATRTAPETGGSPGQLQARWSSTGCGAAAGEARLRDIARPVLARRRHHQGLGFGQVLVGFGRRAGQAQHLALQPAGR
jgi:hypothetical protein